MSLNTSKVTKGISKINNINKNVHKICALSENDGDLAKRQIPENFRGTTLSFNSTNNFNSNKNIHRIMNIIIYRVIMNIGIIVW